MIDMNVFRSVKVQRNILAVLIVIVFVYQCTNVITMTDSWHNSLVELRRNSHQLTLINNTIYDNSNLAPMRVVPKLRGVNNFHHSNVSSNENVKSSISQVIKYPRLRRPQEKIVSNSGLLVPLKLIKGSQYLDERIKQLYLSCRPKVLRKGTDARLFGQCKNVSDMRFIDGSRVVALPSYPGSGNTWTRMLLEQTTGIYTGSIYCDTELKAKGFLGEKLSSSNVLAVKTHYPNKELFVPYKEYHDPEKFKNVSAAIVIVRNPVDSLVSHWNWKHGGHVSVMKPVLFGMFTSLSLTVVKGRWDKHAKQYS